MNHPRSNLISVAKMPEEKRKEKKRSKSILTLTEEQKCDLHYEGRLDTIEHLIRFMGKPIQDVLNELLERMRDDLDERVDEEKMVYTSRIPMGRVRKLAEHAGVNNDGKL